MASFCKIIDLPLGEQVLVMKSYDDEEGKEILQLFTDFDGSIASVKLGFINEKKRDNSFDEYWLDNAIEFRNSVAQFYE